MMTETADGRIYGLSHNEPTEQDMQEAVNVHALIHVARLISEHEGSDFDDVLDELYDRIGAE